MQLITPVLMRINKLHKRILVFLLVLCLATPAGILIPAVFDAGDAWGEWSAITVKDMLGYVPRGLEKYTHTWKAPLPDYSLNAHDASEVHQSGYYIVCGIFGAAITYSVLLIITQMVSGNEK